MVFPASCGKDRKLEVLSYLLVEREQRGRLKQSSHVAVKMRDVDAKAPGSVDLRVQFLLDLIRLGVLGDLGRIQRQIAFPVEQRWDLIFGGHRAPPESCPFTGERL